jgi:hypothetical protein
MVGVWVDRAMLCLGRLWWRLGRAEEPGWSVGVDVNMGIRFYCPNGHKLNVKEFQAGRKGICPHCGARLQIPTESTRAPSKRRRKGKRPKPQERMGAGAPTAAAGAGVPGLAPGPAVPRAAGVPDTRPAAAGGVETLMDGPSEQGEYAHSSAGLPAAGSAAPRSPTLGPQNPLPAPADFSPVALARTAPARPPTPASSAAADPLTEAGEMVWYVRPASGGQFGPAGSEVMRSWLQEGRVGGDSLVWREGWPDWREASKVFPQLAADRPDLRLGEIVAGETSTSSATAARNRRAKSRRRSTRTQALVSLLLIFAVIVLFGVFLWIVTHQ